jgi:hypothetical protein
MQPRDTINRLRGLTLTKQRSKFLLSQSPQKYISKGLDLNIQLSRFNFSLIGLCGFNH